MSAADPTPTWVRRGADRANESAAFREAARWFSAGLELAVGERVYRLRVERGRVVEVAAGPDPAGGLVRVVGEPAAWDELRAGRTDVYQGIWRDQFALEGDVVATLQNLLPIYWLFEAFRSTGEADG